jgi:hypothetical protein
MSHAGVERAHRFYRDSLVVERYRALYQELMAGDNPTIKTTALTL